MACNTNSLSAKTVINICDGKKVGHICNYEVDLSEGRITAVFVPSEGGIFSFSGKNDIRIPWEKIRKIGEDVILADIPSLPPDCVHRKKWWQK